MQRALSLAVVALVALAIMQFVALRRMRAEIAALRAETAALAVETRADELTRAGAWLHAWLQTPDGGARAGGLCPSGTPDMAAINRLIYGTYLRERAAGASEADARERTISATQEAR
jgi:hypothetical protein